MTVGVETELKFQVPAPARAGVRAARHAACALRSISRSHSSARPARCSASSVGLFAFSSSMNEVTSDL